MNGNKRDTFEFVCENDFLPEYLPKVYEAQYSEIACVVLNQGIIEYPTRRSLQDGGESNATITSTLGLNVQVSSRVALPSTTEFKDIVSTTFRRYRDAFQEDLSTMTPFFLAPSSIGDYSRHSEVAEKKGDDSQLPISILIGAIGGGAALAMILAAFVLRRQRSGSRAIFNPVLSADNTSGIKEVFAAEDGCFSVSSTCRPDMPGYVDSPSGTGALTQSASGHVSKSSGVMSVNLSDCSGKRRREQMQRSSAEKKPRPDYLPQVRSSWDNHPRKSGSSENSSLKGLALLQSSSSNHTSTVSASSLGLGRRMYFDHKRFLSKYQDRSRFLQTDSPDVSIDPRRAAGTPRVSTESTPRHARMEDCQVMSPRGDFVVQNETPSGSTFCQMQTTSSAANTGEVLDDLGMLEAELECSKSRVSTSAATPRRGNIRMYLHPIAKILPSTPHSASASTPNSESMSQMELSLG